MSRQAKAGVLIGRAARLGLLLFLLFAMAPVQSLFGESAPATLAIGAPAPDFALPGVDGRTHQLSDYASSKILVVAFLCNHCTASQLYESRIQKIADDYRSKGVALVAIQSDNPESIPDAELAYTDVGESLADMKTRATLRHFSFPYLYDGDTQKTARLFGPVATPQVFVFDQARKLRYKGRVDDNATESLVKSSDARNAIDALLAGKPVETAQTAAAGCALNWKANPDQIKADTAKIEAEPVKLDLAGTEALTKLRANPTGKLLLVNFFATWCGPCVSEFPDLMATNRMYRGRPFVLTTVSSNEPEEKPDVMKFLEKMHASTTNLLFGTTDTYALQAAFDPNMGAAVPFTVLIAPNGDVVFQQQGDLDMMELRRAILANLPDEPGHEGSQKYWATK
jgi:thiol-disulfide isomerase/thioredoxin